MTPHPHPIPSRAKLLQSMPLLHQAREKVRALNEVADALYDRWLRGVAGPGDPPLSRGNS